MQRRRILKYMGIIPVIYPFLKVISFSDSGVAEHSWTVLRGALPKNDTISVYLTGFTPFEKTIIIK